MGPSTLPPIRAVLPDLTADSSVAADRYGGIVDIQIPIIPIDGPLPERGGVGLPTRRAAELGLPLALDSIVAVRGTDGDMRNGKVTHIGDQVIEIAYTDVP